VRVPSEVRIVCRVAYRDGLDLPFSLRLCASRHPKLAPVPSTLASIPRCFSYQAYRFLGSSDLKKIPPIPFARFLADLLALKPCKYSGTDDASESEHSALPAPHER
jgi:hypothetical protein